MKRYVLLVGGTGARLADALLAAASAGAFPEEKLNVLLADTDRRGVQGASLVSAKMADYARIYQAMASKDGPFRTEVAFSSWPRELPQENASLAGFTTGTPWLPVNPNHTEINASAALADPDSVFYHYQKLIRLRKSLPVFRDGSFTLLCPEDEKVFAYTRDNENSHLLVVCNFSDAYLDFEVPENFHGSKLLLSNYQSDCPGLRPYEAAMLYYED